MIFIHRARASRNHAGAVVRAGPRGRERMARASHRSERASGARVRRRDARDVRASRQSSDGRMSGTGQRRPKYTAPAPPLLLCCSALL